MKIKYETELLTVGMLRKMLDGFPDSKSIEFLYDNYENPASVEIKKSPYGDHLVVIFNDK